MTSERDGRLSEKYDLENSHASYPEWFWEQRFRVADLLIMVNKGQTARVAKEIYERFENCILVTWRINAVANLFGQIYYADSNELDETIEKVKAIENVEKLEFSEIVKVVGRRGQKEIAQHIKRRK
jgi:hypothetical protein